MALVEEIGAGEVPARIPLFPLGLHQTGVFTHATSFGMTLKQLKLCTIKGWLCI